MSELMLLTATHALMADLQFSLPLRTSPNTNPLGRPA